MSVYVYVSVCVCIFLCLSMSLSRCLSLSLSLSMFLFLSVYVYVSMSFSKPLSVLNVSKASSNSPHAHGSNNGKYNARSIISFQFISPLRLELSGQDCSCNVVEHRSVELRGPYQGIRKLSNQASSRSGLSYFLVTLVDIWVGSKLGRRVADCVNGPK